MTLSETKACKQWIASYITPSRYINHMHGEIGLRMMMQDDTRVKVTKQEFRDLMLEAGYEPANIFASEWEFRISSKMLRQRPKSTYGGWMASNVDLLRRRA